MRDKTPVYSGHKGCRENKDRSSRRKSGKRPLNRYVLETSSEESFSASSKKLNLDRNMDDFEISASLGYRFINLLSVLMWKKSRRGLGFKIAIICDNCELHEINSCHMIKTHAYDTNYGIVLVMRLLGIELNGIKKCCAFIELTHPIFQSCYIKFVKVIDTAASNVCVHLIINAALEKKRLSEQEGVNNGISASGDDLWCN